MGRAPSSELTRWKHANPQAAALQALRVRHYLTKEQAADALGVHVGYLVLCERGSRPMPPWLVDRVRRLALRLAPRGQPLPNEKRS